MCSEACAHIISHTASYAFLYHTPSNNMTPGDILRFVFFVSCFSFGQTCSEACGELDAVYMGALDGNLCGCGNEEGYLLSLKPEGTCDVVCPGSVGDTCGGSESFDLFLINYLANDDDYFGTFITRRRGLVFSAPG